jgi:hypothetical protein
MTFIASIKAIQRPGQGTKFFIQKVKLLAFVKFMERFLTKLSLQASLTNGAGAEDIFGSGPGVLKVL